jgi:hypothetical protein
MINLVKSIEGEKDHVEKTSNEDVHEDECSTMDVVPHEEVNQNQGNLEEEVTLDTD